MKPAVLRVLLILLILLMQIAISTVYVALGVRPHLGAARAALTNDPQNLTTEQLVRVKAHLRAARGRLRSVPARFLSLVPGARQNLNAVKSVVDHAIPVVTAAEDVKDELDALQREGVVVEGELRLDLLHKLRPIFERQRATLEGLQEAVSAHRNGWWLLPRMQEELGRLDDQIAEPHRSFTRGANALRIAPAMLGDNGPRTYLVLFINNAELRGAGGIVSAVGTISGDRGRLSLGDFDYYVDLAQATPSRRVRAPADFKRRFSRYRADTTQWVNTTASPDVPEVAEVAKRLYRVSAGIDSDGAILVDPRGLAALVPRGEQEVRVPGTDRRLSRAEIPQFVYSEAYELFEGEEPTRREALLTLGPTIVSSAIRGLEWDGLDEIGDAFAAGHLQVVSFDPLEQEVLGVAGASRELATDATDNLLVTVQNRGADKLDFWIRRQVEHECTLDQEGTAACRTEVTLRNETPRGLPQYVVQNKRPYGIYKGYLELYVPERAQVSEFSLNGAPDGVFPEPEDGRLSLGTSFSTRRGRETTAVVRYELDFGDGAYSLEVTPQPLAEDATVEVTLRAPEQWAISGPERDRESELKYSGALDHTLRFEAKPKDRLRGLSALWDRLQRFWREPVFSL